MVNTVIHGDCLIEMKNIKDKSVDLIFTDLPYGTTNNEWDERIDLSELWKEYERIIKDDGAILLFAQSPFDKILACSNLKLYRYEWIIEKTKATGHLNSKKMPLKAHENVLVFYKKLPTYNPQKTEGHKPVNHYTKHTNDGSNYGTTKEGISGGGNTDRYPRDVLRSIKWDTQKECLHPTQKPIELCEYFIKTYTNENDIILDNCCGSGSILLAAKNLNRRYIGIEKYKVYHLIAQKRLKLLDEAK